MLRSILWTTS